MDIGKINKLEVIRKSDSGYYLQEKDSAEIFLPKEGVKRELKLSDLVEVFVYFDEANNMVGDMRKPNIELDQFAYLKVIKILKGDAFVDIGLTSPLKVPFEEQFQKMLVENWYPIFLFKDEKSDYLLGSNKVDDFVFFDEIKLKPGDEVDLLLYRKSELGMNVIVNNMFKGLIFFSDIHKTINLGDKLKGYVKKVRDDGHIDILLEPLGYKKSTDKNSELILNALKEGDGFLELSDKSSPEDINFVLGISKKAFKRSLGNLYRHKLVDIYKNGIKLL